MRPNSRLLLVAICWLVLAGPSWPQGLDKIPSAQEVAKLLRDEPFTPASWPAWQARVRAWLTDRTRSTDKIYEAARKFIRDQADAQGKLTGPLANDHLAWYFLGSSYFYTLDNQNAQPDFVRAEAAIRESIRLDPQFAYAHRNLALVLMVPKQRDDQDRLLQAERELRLAVSLDQTMPLRGIDGQLALRQKKPAEAEKIFRQCLADDPNEAGFAESLASAILGQQPYPGRRDAVGQLATRFPQNAPLACLNAVALAMENDLHGAKRELGRARALGEDPAKLLSPDVVRTIESGHPVAFRQEDDAATLPNIFVLLAWTLAAFAACYAVIMALMALFGLILATRTRGERALDLLQSDSDSLLQGGQIARVGQETLLARLYTFALFLGLILFYVAIPFIVVGLLGVTGGLLMLIFMVGRIPIKLVVFIVIIGLGMTWAVIKSIFSQPASGVFGVPKTAEQAPRLHALVRGVAERVDTDPVDEVYLAPGAAIGVHQEGRGPFGVFGVKRRVLTLGLCTLRFLTIGELQSILAHEYAHFSHKDTFYGRFIYQVHLSIDHALQGMGAAGGWLNYVNPFFWFLFLYYKCYSLLSAGYSRSREFLADRMASHLYGSDVFTRALAKVCTDGALFEMAMYSSIDELLAKQQAFVNMYEAFREYRDKQLSGKDRDELYQKLLGEKGSLFASHPTFAERIDAVASLPNSHQTDNAPALGLFENVEEVEKELTQFLTDYMAFLQQLRMQAEAAAQGN